jgi:hypothetical protein
MNHQPTCRQHREALADLAERNVSTVAGAAAIRHVSRCENCAETLGQLMLTVIALRRMAGEAAEAVPARDRLAGALVWPAMPVAATDTTWTRLRERIERSRRAAREQVWRWRMNLGGVVASALVVSALVGPGAFRVGTDPTALSGQQLEILSWQIEATYDADAHAVPDGVTFDEGPDAVFSGFRQYPDDMRPARKEVLLARPTAVQPDAS